MAKITVPVIKLKYDPEWTFSNKIMDIFEEVLPYEEDPFTYTARISLDLDDPDDVERKGRVVAKLRERLGEEEAGRLLALLDENAWDVSFFVDCF